MSRLKETEGPFLGGRGKAAPRVFKADAFLLLRRSLIPTGGGFHTLPGRAGMPGTQGLLQAEREHPACSEAVLGYPGASEQGGA